ncbi:hypothetical protein [Lysobacter brunescens]|uniref:HsdR n=1 Tax=Lysobacter brunescens TaxID=262323 RepID=A0ABW2YKA1_9GAMM
MSERFDDVVRNAFDFLGRSIDELEQHPKYSVIHFYSAIELFVKARLLKEHWALTVAKPEQADRTKFQRGDFQSVGLREANERLAKIAADGLLEEELKCFDGLRQERNQMVHFAHASQGDGAVAAKELDRIVSDHAKGWLYLRRLLSGRWKDHFDAHAEKISELDLRMREQTKSLERKFMLLTDDISAARGAGRHFMGCPSCGFESFEVSELVWIGLAKCLTCGYASVVVTLNCVNEECGKSILIDDAYECCRLCDHVYSPAVVEALIENESLIEFQRPHDVDRSAWANCGECEGYESAAHLKTGEWFCTECFSLFDEDEIDACEWCGSLTSALPEESMISGCYQCGGYMGHVGDKD